MPLGDSALPAAAGHWWTVRPLIAHALDRRPAPAATTWSTTLEDKRFGTVTLRGLRDQGRSRTLVLVVHGLGGNAESHYAIDAARAVATAGFDSLRLNLRGAGLDGEDFYHAGLSSDLHAVLASRELSDYERVLVLGFSLGGHVALRYATERVDPRVRAVAAVCSPLDLERSAEAIDRPERWPYRRHVLSGLKQSYAAIARRRPVPVALASARRIRRIMEWDELVVAPRHAFSSARQYYREASVGPLLERLAVPSLLVASRHDPMVLERTLRPALERIPDTLEVRWLERGGHVGFPGDSDLGEAAPPGMEHQVVAWLARQR